MLYRTKPQLKFRKLLIVLFFPALVTAQYVKGEWKERDSWMKVAVLFEEAGVQEGMAIADIGCHEGYLSMHLSRAVGSQGQVYAEDVNQNRLRRLAENAKEQGIQNITTILGDYDNPKLPRGQLDVIFVIDTYHEIEAYEKVLKHLRKALKPDGKLLILEKLKAHLRGSSRSAQTMGHTLSPGYVKEELETAGFEIQTEVLDHGLWENESDKQMWFVVAAKSESY